MSKKSPVLVIGDTHMPCMHPGYIRFLKSIEKKHGCKRVVHIGDLVDWAAISYHEKDVSLPSPAEEYKAAKKQVKKLHAAFPKVDILTGNHDALPARKAKTIGIPEEALKDFGSLWGLDGWVVHSRFSDFEIDGVIYRHGDKGKGGQYAAHKNAQAEFQSVVQGHLHAQAGVWYHANHKDCVFGMQVGCGVDHSHPAMSYGKVYSAKPIVGCGVVFSRTRALFEPMPL